MSATSPGGFVPRSSETKEEETVVASSSAVSTQNDTDTGNHGAFGVPQKNETPVSVSLENNTPATEIKITPENYTSPAFKKIAVHIAPMYGLLETYKKNLDESRSNAELEIYRRPLNVQIETLENAQRTFKQIGTAGEDERYAKALMNAVDLFMQEFTKLENNIRKIVSEGRAKKVGAEICVPIQQPDGKLDVKALNQAVEIIKQNLPETNSPEIPETKIQEEKQVDGIPSFVVYQIPPKRATTPAKEPTVVTSAQNTETKDVVSSVSNVDITGVTQATKEVLPPTPVSKPSPEVKLSSPLIEKTEHVSRVNGLVEKIKSKTWADIFLVASLAVSPIPSFATPSPAIKEVVKKEAGESSVFPLSFDDRPLYSVLATQDISSYVSLFGVTDVIYSAVCTKMKDMNITPFKMLHDDSFTTFDIPTSSGTKDVRKEISSLILATGRIASALKADNPVPTDFSNETLEQFVRRVQELAKTRVAEKPASI